MGKEGGNVVGGLPALTLNNGLLATLSLALSERTKDQAGNVRKSGLGIALRDVAQFLGTEKQRTLADHFAGVEPLLD